MRKQLFSAGLYSFLLIGTGCSSPGESAESSSVAIQSLTVSSEACSVVYNVTSEWSGGFGASIEVTNLGPNVNGWTLEFAYPDGQRVTSLWNGSVSQSGSNVSVADAGWNGSLSTGQSASVGLNGTFASTNSLPNGFMLNGASCEGGAPPPTDPGDSNPPPTDPGDDTPPPPDETGGDANCEEPAHQAGTTYGAGDRVENAGKIYECRPYPYSGWCSLAGYEPGEGAYSADAWIEVGACDGDDGSDGGSTGSVGSSGGGDPGTNPPDDGGSDCDAPAWQAGTNYQEGDIVAYGGGLYITVHANPGYDPVISTWFWDVYSEDCSTGGGAGGADPGGSGGSDPGGSDPGSATAFGSIVSESLFNQLFPSRNSFYTYEGLLEAAALYPEFAGTGDLTTRKREAAAFLANVTHETGDLVYVEEINRGQYCDNAPWFCPCEPGKRYYGRGPIQLSWNYNYCAASENIFGDRDVLRRNPERVAQEPWLAWATALWFWMTQTGAGSMTPHNAMVTGAGFGETIRTINGSLECGGRNPSTVALRVGYYEEIISLLGTTAGSNLGC